jgi:hypothetical protein
MNRRDALKVGGAALVSSLIKGRAADAHERLSPAQGGGDFTLTMHGPAILRFPTDGSKATLYFTAFPYAQCAEPVHLPRLSIFKDQAECTTPGQPKGKDSWMVAGLTIEPQMTVAFSAPDYNKEPAPKPYAFPSSDAEWASLQWVPMLKGAVKGPQLEAALDKASTAVVEMPTGGLEALPANDPAARSTLWIWTTRKDWKSRLDGRLKAQDVEPQTYMTDLIVLKGRYTGSAAVVRLRSLLNPAASFDLAFRPIDGGTNVSMTVVAEPPDNGEVAPAWPLELYCPYYEVTPTAFEDRSLPFQSPHTFPGFKQPDKLNKFQDLLTRFPRRPFATTHRHYAKGQELGQATPKPECGSMRLII